jgi:meso-butanediol dehydrogenase / (S,S)-butanediol dehydrogenase / diacetyl reductase
MGNRLEGKVAVITGCTRGIGRASMEKFIDEGAKVAFCGTNAEIGQKLEASLNKDGEKVVFVQADVTDYEKLGKLFDAAIEKFGRLDILFNNAGTGTFGETPDVEIDEWKRMIEIDLNGTFYGCKLGIPLMKKTGGGVIINNASMSGMYADYGLGAYNAAKGGVINYTKTLAMDHGKDNIRANAICPGFINTDATSFMMEQEEGLKQIIKRIPVGRVGQAEDIANGALFLACEESSFMTGTTLLMDGGITCSTNLPDLQ